MLATDRSCTASALCLLAQLSTLTGCSALTADRQIDIEPAELPGPNTASAQALVDRPAPLEKPTQPTVTYAAKHILIQHNDSSRKKADVDRSKEKAKALAEQIAKQAKTPGADFAALAKRFSEGPTAIRGGDLGKFRQGMMHPAFEAALNQLQPGQVSGVVETPFGFHVILRYE